MLSQISEIIPGLLYQSSYYAISPQRLRELGITLVINCTVEMPNVQAKGVEVIQVQCNDLPSCNIKQHFDRIADRIEQERVREGRTLVHCVAGISRSSSLVLAYMVKYRKMSLSDAFMLLRSKRPQVRPNLGFWNQLIEYETKLNGQSSVSMIQSPIGLIPDVFKNEVRNFGASPLTWSGYANGNAHATVVAADPADNANQPRAFEISPPMPRRHSPIAVNNEPAADRSANLQRYSNTFSRLGFG